MREKALVEKRAQEKENIRKERTGFLKKGSLNGHGAAGWGRPATQK